MENGELTPTEVIAAALEMMREILESRDVVSDGSKLERRKLRDTMCSGLSLYYRGKEALGKL